MKKKKIKISSIYDEKVIREIENNTHYLSGMYRSLLKALNTIEQDGLDATLKENIVDQIDYLKTIVYPYDITGIGFVVQEMQNHYSQIDAKIRTKEGDYNVLIHDLGLYERLYQEEGADTFFIPTKSVEEFIDYLVHNDTCEGDIRDRIRGAIFSVSFDQGQRLDDKVILEAAKDITDIILQYRNLASNIGAKEVSYAKTILECERIEKIISKLVEGNVTRKIFECVNKQYIHYRRTNTRFYQALPSKLRTAIDSEVYDGKTYQYLYQNYQKFLKGEEFDLPEKEGMKELFDEQESILKTFVDFYLLVDEAARSAYEMKNGNGVNQREEENKKNNSYLEHILGLIKFRR